MNLLKTTFLAYTSALIGGAAVVVNAQDDTAAPAVPNLNGQNFKITVRRDFVLCQKLKVQHGAPCLVYYIWILLHLLPYTYIIH